MLDFHAPTYLISRISISRRVARDTHTRCFFFGTYEYLWHFVSRDKIFNMKLLIQYSLCTRLRDSMKGKITSVFSLLTYYERHIRFFFMEHEIGLSHKSNVIDFLICCIVNITLSKYFFISYQKLQHQIFIINLHKLRKVLDILLNRSFVY